MNSCERFQLHAKSCTQAESGVNWCRLGLQTGLGTAQCKANTMPLRIVGLEQQPGTVNRRYRYAVHVNRIISRWLKENKERLSAEHPRRPCNSKTLLKMAKRVNRGCMSGEGTPVNCLSDAYLKNKMPPSSTWIIGWTSTQKQVES